MTRQEIKNRITQLRSEAEALEKSLEYIQVNEDNVSLTIPYCYGVAPEDKKDVENAVFNFLARHIPQGILQNVIGRLKTQFGL